MRTITTKARSPNGSRPIAARLKSSTIRQRRLHRVARFRESLPNRGATDQRADSMVVPAMSRLLRNCSLDDLTGRKVDKPETEIGRALSQSAKDVDPVLCVVRVGAGIGIDETLL